MIIISMNSFQSTVEIHEFHVFTSYIYICIYMHACMYVRMYVIWQAPRAGSMRRILCSDWLPERARWSDTARPGLPVSFPQTNISPKSKRVHESFLSQNIFRDSKKIFCDLFVGMELENEKTETRHHFCI